MNTNHLPEWHASALNGQTVTQAHADYCEANGHATHTVDGVNMGKCPRCGEVTIPAIPADTETGLYEVRGMNILTGNTWSFATADTREEARDILHGARRLEYHNHIEYELIG